MKDLSDRPVPAKDVTRVIKGVLGLIALSYTFVLLKTIILNGALFLEFEIGAHNTIASIISGSAVSMALAIPAWIAVVISILSVIFTIIWIYGGLWDAWWNNWLARWMALGNCTAFPTWWQRLKCRLDTLVMIEELLVVGAGTSIIGAIAVVNVAAALG